MVRCARGKASVAVATVVALLSAFSAIGAPLDTISAGTLRVVDDPAVAVDYGSVSGSPRDTDAAAKVAEVPPYCLIQTGTAFNAPGYLSAGDQKYDDKRDSMSAYACTTSDKHSAITFKTVPVPEDGGFLLLVSENNMEELNDENLAEGWYLSVHNAYRSDEDYDDFVRACLHKLETKAAVWKLVDDDKRNRKVLQLVNNRNGEPSTDWYNWYLAVPSEARRTATSMYAAVTPYMQDATPAEIIEAAQ